MLEYFLPYIFPTSVLLLTTTSIIYCYNYYKDYKKAQIEQITYDTTLQHLTTCFELYNTVDKNPNVNTIMKILNKNEIFRDNSNFNKLTPLLEIYLKIAMPKRKSYKINTKNNPCNFYLSNPPPLPNVTEEFHKLIAQREKDFPTGLPLYKNKSKMEDNTYFPHFDECTNDKVETDIHSTKFSDDMFLHANPTVYNKIDFDAKNITDNTDIYCDNNDFYTENRIDISDFDRQVLEFLYTESSSSDDSNNSNTEEYI
jgi:hypothetical protein